MSEGFWTLFWIALLVVFVGWLIKGSIEANRAFEAKMQTEYQTCINAKESLYTCKVYIESMRARRSADEAATMSAVSVGMAGANSGSKR